MSIWQVTPYVEKPALYSNSDEPVKRGRKPIGLRAMTSTESSRKSRGVKTKQRIEHIAILDFETDPFDAEKETEVKPFLAVLYGEKFEPVVIWEENNERFVDAVIRAIEALPGEYTIYAHNGGKFDYLFLIHRLRGFVSFKGRGLMSARIGNHELRDSFHIIPEKLANWQKDTFDYSKLQKSRRRKYRADIISYCINDCKYLLEIVKAFLNEFGFRISIGQAAMYELRKSYKVETIGAAMDEYLRQYFFGGRVECLAGRGVFTGDYKLYDVNSMYPYVMANCQHPIGNNFTIRSGEPNAYTCFVRLRCSNRGALVSRGDSGTSADAQSGEFFATIHEFNVAKRYSLIGDIDIINCVDCSAFTDFSAFVNPLYNRRQETKALLRKLPEGSFEYNEAKKNDIFLKLILNNAYGKFAQNPRNYKETYITNHGERPPEDETGFGDMPVFDSAEYDIWERPQEKLRFNNVATAASITGAARAVLLEAIQNADDPVYCDTDSLICRGISGVTIDPVLLGAWDIEKEIDEIIVCGKKLYAYKVHGLPDGHKKRVVVRSKGASGLTWEKMMRILDDQIIESISSGVTLTKRGQQYYMKRNIRATVPYRENKYAASRIHNLQRVSA